MNSEQITNPDHFFLIDDFQSAMLRLDSKKFNKLLAKNVSLLANSEVSGKTKLKGKEAVISFYQDKFFGCSRNIIPNSIHIDVRGKHPVYSCDVIEDKINDEMGTYTHLQILDTVKFSITTKRKKPKIRRINCTVKANIIYSISIMEANKLVEQFCETMRTNAQEAGDFLTEDFSAKVKIIKPNEASIKVVNKEDFLSENIYKSFDNPDVNSQLNGCLSFGSIPVKYNQFIFKKESPQNPNSANAKEITLQISGKYHVIKLDHVLKICKASVLVTTQPKINS